MRNISVLINALKIIEERIKEPLKMNDLAEACFSSCSSLQKLFNYALKCSANDYITKRRISCASRELVTNSKSIIELAFDYQYGSPEAFSRAFKRVWGISPNEFRKTRRFTDLFPKHKIETNNGGIIMQRRRPIDISELYDELKKLKDTFLLSIDINGLDPVNKNYGTAAGDLVIAEAFTRLEQETDDNMLLFRIGGDEFAIVTGYSSLCDAEELAQKITARNGETVKAGGNNIPVSFRVGICRLPNETLNYRKTLEIMYGSMDKALNSDGYIAVYSETT